MDAMIEDKVLSDERTFAYATTIGDIKRWWSNCKECNWYKSEQTVVTPESCSINIIEKE